MESEMRWDEVDWWVAGASLFLVHGPPASPLAAGVAAVEAVEAVAAAAAALRHPTYFVPPTLLIFPVGLGGASSVAVVVVVVVVSSSSKHTLIRLGSEREDGDNAAGNALIVHRVASPPPP
ncbi:hypothetical protein HZH66_013603 [Vespula vulgaris]|uniref:Uncharacterized protein n=1 Tax=Vespula vulgaris TaxID=7454 RepID=A0A834JAR5_VESVU|nr:hypothetical protein HZH66_013603 [Vespula vulgaris]